MEVQHASLAAGRWQTLTLAEQLGNIGSEVSRAARAQGKDENGFKNAVGRALELFEFTLQDPRWRGRYREIARAREVFLDAVSGGAEYQSSLQELVPYFDQFAYVARLRV